jgi:hypothetical protein
MNLESFPQFWMDTLCRGTLSDVLDLYNPRAVLIPTFSPKILQGHAEIAEYFRTFMSREGLCGQIDSVIQQGHTDIVSISGLYTFGWYENGMPAQGQARYTYVVSHAHTPSWQIVTHHSSAMPD